MFSATSLSGLREQVADVRARSRDVIVRSDRLRFDLENLPVDIEPETPDALKWSPDLSVRTVGPDFYQCPLTATLSETAMEQLAYRLDIPRSYFRRCYEADREDVRRGMRADQMPILLDNITHWSVRDPSQWMVRTLLNSDGGEAVCRAILSNRYLRLDHEPVLDSILDGLSRASEDTRIETLSAGLTDRRMFLTMLLPDYPIDLGGGDIVRPGFTVKNSETGYGAVGVYAFLYRDRCTNGMIFGKRDLLGFERRHVGAVRDEGVMSPETHEKLGELLASQAKDVVSSLTDPATLEELVAPLRAAKESGDVESPFEAFTELAQAVGLRKDEKEAAVVNFIRDADYSRFGMSQAVTRLANSDPGNSERSYDRTVELAEIGADIVQLPERQWRRVQTARSKDAPAAA